MLTIQVFRAYSGGKFKLEYQTAAEGNRVQARLTIERMQDMFDVDGDPLRAYLAKGGIPIEAAYCLRGARD